MQGGGCVVPDVADVAVEGLDVVAVRVEKKCRVVAKGVGPVSRRTVRAIDGRLRQRSEVFPE